MSELSAVYRYAVRTARKPHKCCECHGAIQPGEQYHCHQGVWDGKGKSYKVCLECEALRREVDAHALDDAECTGLGDLAESAMEMSRANPAILERFAANAKRRGGGLAAERVWVLEQEMGKTMSDKGR